jgi:hypothetical protein
LGIWETKTARPASALANNLPADDAGNRFHGGFYGAGLGFGQGGEKRPGAAGQSIRLIGCSAERATRKRGAGRLSHLSTTTDLYQPRIEKIEGNPR